MMTIEQINIHNSHCCKRHGCKYGDYDCPVVRGACDGVECEDCGHDNPHRGSDFDDFMKETEQEHIDTIRLNFFEANQSLFRYSPYPTMCGKHPCWYVWTYKEGRTTRKTLREAIDAAMNQ